MKEKKGKMEKGKGKEGVRGERRGKLEYERKKKQKQ